MTWLREALSAVPIAVRPKHPTTHVEAVLQGSQDGGSIPPASIITGCARQCRPVIFLRADPVGKKDEIEPFDAEAF